MSRKIRLARENLETLLELFADANCPNGCKCIFCRTFDRGYQAGLEDALNRARRQLADFSKKLDSENNLG